MSDKFCDTTIQNIARDTLSIPNLETRNSDSLDFHDVYIGALHNALEQAYAAGFDYEHGLGMLPDEVSEKMQQTLKTISPYPLEVRNSDSLDFHEMACWSIKSLMKNAFQAGALEPAPTTSPSP